LSGLQFNISGIVGPALGGLLVSVAGANFVFALNAACFLLVVLGIRQWKQRSAPPKLPSEGFFESFGTVISYARNTPNFQVVLALFSPRETINLDRPLNPGNMFGLRAGRRNISGRPRAGCNHR
jgi:MFS family permease